MKTTIVILAILVGSQPTRSGHLELTEPHKKEVLLEQSKKPRLSNLEIVLLAVKSQEGIRLNSYYDTNHWSIGWGTTCQEGDTIDLEAANTRLKKVFSRKLSYIKLDFPEADKWTQLVLAMTRYNVPSFGSILREAVRSGDKDRIGKALMLYIHDANGKALRGLKRRRRLEVKLLKSSGLERQKLGVALRKIVAKKIKRLK